MGVPRPTLPQWDDIQLLPAQLRPKPLAEDAAVGTELVIGPNAKRPLRLEIPIFVSDMSFGALSQEAKTALAKGAEMAGTGIASGEGGMLPEENAANSRYLFELGSAGFGYSEAVLSQVQAFHFKAGQAAKTGTGGHLPGNKVTAKIAQVRNLPEGRPAVSPPAFADLTTPADYRRFADRVRELTGGIPIGVKMSAQRIEAEIDFALEAGVDYIILDGRGGATGAAPLLFRDNISVPTIPALARARRHLDRLGRSDITLIITGGLRTPADFIKAMCLGADGIAIANAAIQAVGCVGARICHTNNCPSGIATQQEHLRARLDVDESPARLARFLTASVELMKVMARACGHTRLSEFSRDDITTWKRDMADLSGVKYAGIGWSPPDNVSEGTVPFPNTEQGVPGTPKEETKRMSTQENLQEAFAGESQANRTYLAFAKKAEAEGHPQIAKLFRAAAEAETVHAHAHLRVMGGVKDTKANLQVAIDGEGHEFKAMYPGFIKEAEAEGNKAALISFRNAMAVEEIHHSLYSEALESLAAGSDLPAAAIHVCDVCGNTVVGEVPDKCPVCGAPRARFQEVA
ncbi:MAG: glutamate synthase-related protein [Thermoguttaceae bacterium]|nr:glutamate synthase-related protein [Thermoguttaceae bacterium]